MSLLNKMNYYLEVFWPPYILLSCIAELVPAVLPKEAGVKECSLYIEFLALLRC